MTTIRFERDGAIGHIVLANPPFNRLDLMPIVSSLSVAARRSASPRHWRSGQTSRRSCFRPPMPARRQRRCLARRARGTSRRSAR